jgi:hypothetical protein
MSLSRLRHGAASAAALVPPGAALALLQAGSTGGRAAGQAPAIGGIGDRIRTSPAAWLLAGLLTLAAAYFLVRLMELDLMNRETPHQEDPFLK